MDSLVKERELAQHPLVVVISGPSGVGKDVIIDQMIVSDRLGFHFVVTTTSIVVGHRKVRLLFLFLSAMFLGR